MVIPPFDDFLKTVNNGHYDNFQNILLENANKVQEANLTGFMQHTLDLAIAVSVEHNLVLLRAYHNWLTEQLSLQ
jgi:hypothetical protein